MLYFIFLAIHVSFMAYGMEKKVSEKLIGGIIEVENMQTTFESLFFAEISQQENSDLAQFSSFSAAHVMRFGRLGNKLNQLKNNNPTEDNI